MVGVSTGEVSPIFAGHTYCSLIEACQEISDFGRVAQWTTALTTWCDGQVGLVPFTGQCAVHRGQVMRVRGAFEQAIAELDGAAARYVAAETPAAAGLAFAEKGGLLRIRGEYVAAEEAFQQAMGLGHDPQPAHALLSVARGRTDAALAAVRRVLGEPRDPIHRSQLLPGAIEVLLAGNDLTAARPLVAELVGSETGSGRSRSGRWLVTPWGPWPLPGTDPRKPSPRSVWLCSDSGSCAGPMRPPGHRSSWVARWASSATGSPRPPSSRPRAGRWRR